MLDARADAPNQAITFWSITNTAPMYSAPYAYTSATIAGLADLIGVADPEKLAASFGSGQEISSMFGAGTQLTDDPNAMIPGVFGAPDTKAVFTATKAVPSSIGSMGGLKINTNAEVLSGGDTTKTPITAGEPIPGLYAAGETANGDLFYLEYPGSGTSLSVGATFGRFAGQNAANKVPLPSPPPYF
jgi:hypothetical protein